MPRGFLKGLKWQHAWWLMGLLPPLLWPSFLVLFTFAEVPKCLLVFCWILLRVKCWRGPSLLRRRRVSAWLHGTACCLVESGYLMDQAGNEGECYSFIASLGVEKKKNHLSKVLPFCLVGKWTKPWGLSHVLSNPIGMIKITYASSIFHWNQFRNQNQNQKRNKEPATFWVRSQTRDWKNKIIVGGSTKGDRETQEVQGHEEQLKRKAHRSQALPHHLSGPILRSVDTWEKDRRQISFSEGCFRLQ